MTFQFNPAFPDATNEHKWEQIKLWRNAKLAQSDWTQLPDAPVDQAAWATYRQALRDLPASNTDPRQIEFPAQPGGN
jgi:hypothetical protein